MRITKIHRWLSSGFALVTPWRVGRVVALAALLAMGAGVYFNTSLESVESKPSPAGDNVPASLNQWPIGSLLPDTPYYRDPDWNESQGANQKIDSHSSYNPEVFWEMTDLFSEEVVAALGYEILLAKLDQYQIDGLLTSRDLERLDQEIDLLLIAAVDKASEDRAAHYREIERLEGEIASLLAEARQDPTTNPSQLGREIQRLDDQIDMMRITAITRR